MHRFRSARVRSCETPLDPFLYLHCDPSDSFEVKDVMGAGRGLLAARSFQEKSFLLNYRGTIKSATGDNSDNVYTFQLKEPENVNVDASERPDCLARYINDIDCFHSKNCEVKVLRKDKKWAIAFFATIAILEGEELRYRYGSQDAPWRKESFWTKVCGLATQAPKNNSWEKRRQDELLKEDDVSGTIANKKKKMPITAEALEIVSCGSNNNKRRTKIPGTTNSSNPVSGTNGKTAEVEESSVSSKTLDPVSGTNAETVDVESSVTSKNVDHVSGANGKTAEVEESSVNSKTLDPVSGTNAKTVDVESSVTSKNVDHVSETSVKTAEVEESSVNSKTLNLVSGKKAETGNLDLLPGTSKQSSHVSLTNAETEHSATSKNSKLVSGTTKHPEENKPNKALNPIDMC